MGAGGAAAAPLDSLDSSNQLVALRHGEKFLSRVVQIWDGNVDIILVIYGLGSPIIVTVNSQPAHVACIVNDGDNGKPALCSLATNQNISNAIAHVEKQTITSVISFIQKSLQQICSRTFQAVSQLLL